MPVPMARLQQSSAPPLPLAPASSLVEPGHMSEPSLPSHAHAHALLVSRLGAGLGLSAAEQQAAAANAAEAAEGGWVGGREGGKGGGRRWGRDGWPPLVRSYVAHARVRRRAAQAQWHRTRRVLSACTYMHELMAPPLLAPVLLLPVPGFNRWLLTTFFPL